jgi:glutamate---cysteine ligase / carboxylate-amine ligase
MNFRFGIEEEFFVVCRETQALVPRAHEGFLARAARLSDGAVRRELLQSQVEAATPVCETFAEARHHLQCSRAALREAGRRYGLSVIAAGTHPTADWLLQRQTEKRRYDAVMAELQMLGLRNLVCGMHVHVDVADDELRLDVMRRSIPFLPLLLALSTSSPFWRGMHTGFSSYRLTAYDELPRTGLPPLFSSVPQYRAYTEALADAGVIRDSSFIWWAIRPSHKYPTLELRIPDACTALEDTLAIAALYRCLVCALTSDRAINRGIDSPRRAIAKENKWRVQRFGLAAELVDPFRRRAAIDAPTAVRRLLELVRPHAAALDCLPEVEHVETILARGTSADRQVAIYEGAIEGGCDEGEALRRVSAWLQRETLTAGCREQVPGFRGSGGDMLVSDP